MIFWNTSMSACWLACSNNIFKTRQNYLWYIWWFYGKVGIWGFNDTCKKWSSTLNDHAGTSIDSDKCDSIQSFWHDFIMMFYEACVAEGGGVRGRGLVCMARGGKHGRGGVHGRGAMCGGGMHGREGGHAWRGACMVGGMHGRGHAWQGACVVGGIHGRGVYMADTMRYSQWAGGTHPTGMHTCKLSF